MPLPPDAEPAARKDAQKNVQGGDRSSYVKPLKAGYTRSCTDPWTFAQVLGDGRVRPCCFSFVELGNVTNSSFEEVYNSESAQNLRHELLTGKLDEYCTICNMKAMVPVEDFQKEITRLYETVESGGRTTHRNPAHTGLRRLVWDMAQSPRMRTLSHILLPVALRRRLGQFSSYKKSASN